jgi:YHS domain-containing protein
MAHALRRQGASWTNALVFMVASTNLVIELAVVLAVLLGAKFVVAQIIGGLIMVTLLGLTSRWWRRVAPPTGPVVVETSSPRRRLRERQTYIAAAKFTVGDLTMIRSELAIGFVVSGFLSAHVSERWWRDLFLTGHGWLTIAENVIVAPFVAVISFVCSVGNIPLAATLWAHGVSFAGVIAFIFADLITLPLIAIYRRYYGARSTAQLVAGLWLIMSATGVLVELLFSAVREVPHRHSVSALQGKFPLGFTLWANIFTALLLAGVWALSRKTGDATLAVDPVCGMSVDVRTAVATVERDGTTYFFCAERCARKFVSGAALDTAHAEGDDMAVDPVCGMSVDPATAPATVMRDGRRYFFCAQQCADAFITDATSDNSPMREDVNGDARCPRCQMRVDSASTPYSLVRNTNTIFFCSAGCRDSFAMGAPEGSTAITMSRRHP